MKKMLYITNIPTPYRNYRFNQMARIFAENGIEVEVLYMNAGEPDRNWTIDYSQMKHHYRVFSSNKVFMALGMWMHLTPRLQIYLLRNDYDIAVLGGLASPAHFMASLLLNKRSVNLLSVESNMASIGNRSGIATKVKNFLMRRFTHFQVTGKRSIEFIKHYVPSVDERNIVTLPNVINEVVFDQADKNQVPANIKAEFDRAREQGHKLVLTPARLIDEKGLLPLFNALQSDDKLSIFIAGDGPLKAQIESIINERNLNVRLLGPQPPEQVANMMKYVDYLCLPSKSDPSPLSVIEACACGLPLLISKNVGNYDDVLVEGSNGWGFTFDDQAETRQALEHAMSQTEQEHLKMREVARKMFEDNFATEKVLKRYLDELTALAAG